MDFEIVSEIAEIGLLPQAREFATASSSKILWWYSLAEAKRSCAGPIGEWYDTLAEVHWYEAHGVGKREFKLKLPLLD
jgi:hypothetical protein